MSDTKGSLYFDLLPLEVIREVLYNYAWSAYHCKKKGYVHYAPFSWEKSATTGLWIQKELLPIDACCPHCLTRRTVKYIHNYPHYSHGR